MSPDGTEVAYTFYPRADLNRSEIRVAAIEGGEMRALTGTPRMHDREPAWSPDGSDRRLHLGAQRVLRAASGRPRRRGRASDHHLRRRLQRTGMASRRHPHPGGPGRPQPLPAGECRRRRRQRGDARPRRDVVHALLDRPGRRGRRLRGPRHAARAPPRRPGGETTTIHAPAPKAVKAAPYAALEEVAFSSFDGLEIPGLPDAAAGASAERPVRRWSIRTAGPRCVYADEWDGHAQYFIDQGYAWLALNFRGSTGYGREFERLEPRRSGERPTRRTAWRAPTSCARSTGSTASRLAIFGASYGSLHGAGLR